jgi:hypothetical protein
MKNLVSSFLILSALTASSTCLADGKTARVFAANESRHLVGRNDARPSATPCSVRFFDDTQMYYSFSNDITVSGSASDALNRRANSISAGHFSASFFSRELVASQGGGLDFSCIVGQCVATELTVRYDSDLTVTGLEFKVNGKIIDTCDFD